MSLGYPIGSARNIAERVAAFVRTVVVPYENDVRWRPHGPSDEMANELKEKARAAGVLNPHINGEGRYLSHRDTAIVLRAAGLSPLGPVAVNVAAPDEGNMYLLHRIGTVDQKMRFLQPLLEGRTRSAFFMTEPASEGGAGSDPSMLQTVASADGDGWRITGRKAFITGAEGASVGIVMAKTDAGATLFVIPLPDPAVRVERIVTTLDGSMPGGHAIVALEGLRVSAYQVLGQVNRGFENAQVRLAPARLTHCMRWLGAATRANEIATDYAITRQAFGKSLIDHEGVGFMLADNLIDLKQAELMIDWCAGVLDSGALGITESSMTKVAVSEGLYRVADRCVQMMGAIGLSADTIVSRVFNEIRGFRIYDGPTEVHKWSLAKKIKRDAAT
jgi:acyl-CoA dehydrogenase